MPIPPSRNTKMKAIQRVVLASVLLATIAAATYTPRAPPIHSDSAGSKSAAQRKIHVQGAPARRLSSNPSATKGHNLPANHVHSSGYYNHRMRFHSESVHQQPATTRRSVYFRCHENNELVGGATEEEARQFGALISYVHCPWAKIPDSLQHHFAIPRHMQEKQQMRAQRLGISRSTNPVWSTASMK